MKRESAATKARRARRRELFNARMCLHDCGRPASATENLCAPCSAALTKRYFDRLAALEQPR